MFIEVAIINLLKSNSRLTTLIQKIYPNQTTKDAKYPLIVYSYDETDLLIGNAKSEFKTGEFLFLSFAENKTIARQIEKEINISINGLTDVINGIHVKYIKYNGFEDDFDKDVQKYFYQSTYRIIYKEDI